MVSGGVLLAYGGGGVVSGGAVLAYVGGGW